MAWRPALSTATGGKIYTGTEIRDFHSLLDVVYANQFEGQFQKITPEDVAQTEKHFYRGAPPNWLNFHLSKQAESDGTETSIIKRDGYDTLVQQIRKRRKDPGTSAIKLFHQQGCGGTTLAMQVLWDLRKTFRCAVLKGPTSDVRNVAKEVVDLFTAGSQQNTVLLLMNDEFILDSLQDSIMEEIAKQEMDIDMAVAVFLNCVRASDHVILKMEQSHIMKQRFKSQQRNYVILKKELTATEKQKFNEKKKELSKRYGDECKRFHGFNILQSNFSQAYIQEACAVFKTVKRANKPKSTQLAAFLSLLNAHVPGSYLLESQCMDLLKHKDSIHGDCSLQEKMDPFSDLIITFKQDVRPEMRVRMAHPMIAQCCIELMAEAGVTRSDTARNLLTCLCRDEVPPFLLGFVREMLTKREIKKEGKKYHYKKAKKHHMRPRKTEEDQERFSRLILHIGEMENKQECVSVLKVASNTFVKNSLFPQALARFYCIELQDYNKAEKWAKEAKERDPQNSVISDTLGQVYKNHLKFMEKTEAPAKPTEILQLATKAIKAFQDEEQLAEIEQGTDMKEGGNRKVLRALNTRGQFGYLQVSKLVYDLLVSQNETWKGVLTKNVSMGSVLQSLGDNKLFRFNDLLNSLRDEVEKKCEFFDAFLTYSESFMRKVDPSYISRETSDCYKKYVGDLPPKHKEKSNETIQNLKQKLAATSPGVLSCFDRGCTTSELQQIAAWWKEIYESTDSTKCALANYVLANIMLVNQNETPSDFDYKKAFAEQLSFRDPPELNLLAMLIQWPRDDEDKCDIDLSQLITKVQLSYENQYQTLFRSRYLRPLFFIGKNEGLERYVHRRVLNIWMKNALQDSNTNWRNESFFKDSTVQEHLLKIEGVVRDYQLYATFGGTEIEVDVNRKGSLWKSGQVSFNLGFTIAGPVAFSIQRGATNEGNLELGSCGGVMDSVNWTKLEPGIRRVEEVQTYSLQSDAGRFECSVSALRWVCKEKVRFKYQFCAWEEYREKTSCVDYMPAGPMLDITVSAGKLEEVHLPHWICVDDNTKDMFAVLHVDTCGDYVESVSEVTSSHVKLFQPVFSPRGAMIRKKLGIPVKVFYETLIYKTIKANLTMHVYLVPPDPVVQQAVEREEKSDGSKRIKKPSPDKPLKMEKDFFLSTDVNSAEICPDKLKLTSERRNPNFFEVFIRDAETDFNLKLEIQQKKGMDTVWTCTIRTKDYQRKSINKHGQHFVDLHRTALINGVADTGAILDELKAVGLISGENYKAVRALTTTEDQMRDILNFVTSAGERGKDVFYDILKGRRNLSFLMSELEGSQ